VSVRHAVPAEPSFASSARAFEDELDYIYRALRRHGVQATDAEDLAQEVFLVMWRRWQHYDHQRPLRAWLAGIAFKVAHHHHRSPWRREIPHRELEPADERPDAEDQLAVARLRALVLRILEAIPEKYRSILVMHELDGVPVREIASTLEMPIFTVHSRLRRARLRFAKILQEMGTVALAPEALLALESRYPPAPAAVKERIRAFLATPGLRLPAPLPPPVSWAPLALGTAAAALAVVTVAVWQWPAPRPGVAARETRPAPSAPVAEPDLVGYWSFDDPAGTVVRDRSGRGNDCLFHDADPPVFIAGVQGQALDLRHRGWLECPQPPATAGVPFEMTISLWMRRAHQTPAAALVRRHLGPGREHLFIVGFQEDNLRVWGNAWKGWTTRDVPESIDRWTHVAFTHSPRSNRLFIDGRLAVEHENRGWRPRLTTSAPLTIGAVLDATGVSQHFHGAVDEIRLYDRALTGEQVAALAAPR
jgi:RNA polymerase sigma-70 factor (ECF subfamily)